MDKSHSLLRSVNKQRRLIKVLFFLLSVVISLLFLFFLRVKNVTTEGNSYTQNENIITSASILPGTHMYAINKEEISSRIIKENSYICDVEIRRVFPCSIKIIVKEEKPVFYTSFSGKYYLLTETLRVLKTTDSAYSLSSEGAVPIILSGISAAENGKYLAFADDNMFSLNTSIISSFLSSEIGHDITSIDISQRFDIKAMYKSKYTLVFGSYENLDVKIPFCIKTIRYTENNMPSVTGTVYAIRENETSFVVTGTIS